MSKKQEVLRDNAYSQGGMKMETTKKHLVLVFETATGEEEILTITKPKDALEPAQIKAVMNTVVESGAVGEKVAVARIGSAKYVIQQVDQVNLEEE